MVRNKSWFGFSPCTFRKPNQSFFQYSRNHLSGISNANIKGKEFDFRGITNKEVPVVGVARKAREVMSKSPPRIGGRILGSFSVQKASSKRLPYSPSRLFSVDLQEKNRKPYSFLRRKLPPLSMENSSTRRSLLTKESSVQFWQQ